MRVWIVRPETERGVMFCIPRLVAIHYYKVRHRRLHLAKCLMHAEPAFPDMPVPIRTHAAGEVRPLCKPLCIPFLLSLY
jgi:hypothetical protein